MVVSEIVSAILSLEREATSMKVVASGEILVSGDWFLIRVENTIVTLYKCHERDLVHKRISSRNDVKPRPTAIDPHSGGHIGKDKRKAMRRYARSADDGAESSSE